ncbi:MAG TPA: flagellar hook-basal body complex protein FliE [Deltaproteobacteria bacterium]|jgi:flagellar hook-basal body complex protein FliE|nr:flagellar hook-basal body complex protein FliE [Deltaproteobacteria bacterium]HOI08261.1 flagellar hook-basal body complex protein FliE [Deltaproteobacteria bacterium]
MRIELSDFPRLQIDNGIGQKPKAPATTFLDVFKDAVNTANEQAMEANRSAVALARGESGNIHETMIAMQKADIDIRLLVAVTNKLIDAYNQLTQLR